MKITIRIISLLLAVLMAGVALIACGNDTTPAPTPTPPADDAGDTPAEPSEDGKTDYMATLPVHKYNGRDYTILCRTDKEYEMFCKEDDAVALVEQAVFARNNRVGTTYDVNIVTYAVNGTYEERSTFMGALNASVASGDDAYQLVATHTAYNALISIDDKYYNLRDISTLDLSNPWWSQSFNEHATMYDVQFLTTGDLALTMWEGLYAVFFNKEMAEAQGTGNLYEIVEEGDWTLELLYELSEIGYRDDGNDSIGVEDTFGFVTNRHSVRTFVTACEIPLAEQTPDGGYELVFIDENRTIDLYEQVYELIYENEGVYYHIPTTADHDYSGMTEIFTAGRALFMSGTLDNAPALRQSEVEFGILPFPKYDEDQENYLSHSYDGLSSFGIPLCAYDPEMCGMILEALCAESSYSVIPNYYDVVLQGRLARDEESKEVLDTIRENLYFDFGFVYSGAIGKGLAMGPFALFGDACQQGKQLNIAYAENESIYTTNLESIIEYFANYGK